MSLLKRISSTVLIGLCVVFLYSCKEESPLDIKSIQIRIIEKIWKLPQTEIYLSLDKSYYKTGSNIYEFNITEQEADKLVNMVNINSFMRLKKKYGQSGKMQIPDNYYEISLLKNRKLVKMVSLHNIMIEEIKEIKDFIGELCKSKIGEERIQ